jgi:GT2 family glycosyltransferase
MKLSIIIVNWNTRELTAACLQSIEQTQAPRPEIIVVDNGSTDGSADFFEKKFPQIKLVRLPENCGFAAGNNVGIREATREITLLLNSDTILIESLAPLLGEFKDPRVGVVAPKLLNSDRSLQPVVRYSYPSAASVIRENPYIQRLFGPIPWGQHEHRAEMAWAAGAALLIKTALLREIGGLDEQFFMYYEETDLCKQVHTRGYKLIFNPAVSIVHLGGASEERKKKTSLGPVYFYRSQLQYLRKHRVPGRLLVRSYLAFSSLLLWGLMKIKGKPDAARNYRLVLKNCLTV